MAQINHSLDIKKALEDALNFCMQGQLDQAKNIYRVLIVKIPDEIQVLNNLGVIEIQEGNISLGAELLRKSLNITPTQPQVLNNLGNAYLEMEKLDEALHCFKKAGDLDSSQVHFYFNQARALKAQGQNEEAILTYSQAIFLNKNYLEAYLNRGVIYHQNKKYIEALDDFSKVIELNHNYIEAYFNRGNLFNDLKRWDLAISDLSKFIEMNPLKAEPYHNRALAFHELKEYKNAYSDYNKSIELKFDFAEAYYNRGRLHDDLENLDSAIQDYNEAISKNSLYAEAFNNRGTIYYQKNEIDLAFKDYQQAITLDDNYSDAYDNLGRLYLLTKNFALGWPLYESRLLKEEFQYQDSKLDENKRLKELACKNKKILILAEQGIGDEIFYSRMLPLIQKENQLTCLVDKRLINLFHRSFPKIRFLSKDTNIDQIEYDYFTSLASLGLLTDYHPRNERVYLSSDSLFINKEALGFSHNKKYICGVAWKSANKKLGINKSMELKNLLPILQIPNIDFINLQYGDTKKEIADMKANYSIDLINVDSVDQYNNIDGLTSLINICDFVVTTSNVTAHIAGAIGKQAYVLLPFTKGKIWYWHDGIGKSEWYPSLDLFSQDIKGDWRKPTDQIKDKIVKAYE
jgi:tetratricopeptide (TPR) repeat protein